MPDNKTRLLTRKLIRPDISQLSAYRVADASGMIKLDAMENPFHWSDELKIQWLEWIKGAELNRYPDPHARQLTNGIRAAFDIPDQMEIMLGNGSDEIIQVLIQALAKPEATVLSVAPGFVMYEYISLFCQMKYVAVPLTDSFELDMPMMIEQIEQQQPAIIFIAYPNNPTGNLFVRADIEKILSMAPGLVVIDEAYTAFASDSFMGDLVTGQHPNLLVMRTVSKMGLAGLRLGYIVGDPQWISEFDKVRLPYNINVLTQLTVEFALQHKSVLDQQAEAICAERSRLISALERFEQFQVFSSQANFVLIRCPAGKGDAIFTLLKESGILIKNLSAVPALSDCLRITVGSTEENNAVLSALT